jgi:excisionase family DNA binding protein
MTDDFAPMYRPDEIAERCRVSRETVMRAIRTGRLRASRLGARGSYRVRAEDLEAWIIATTVLPPVSHEYRLPSDPPLGGRLIVGRDNGRRGHRAPPPAP